MAVSAFRSTSKRGNFGASSTTISSARENHAEDMGKKIPLRRSRSVSAASRTYSEISSSSSNVLEFSNKMDNPLFSNSSPSSPEERESKNMVSIGKFAAYGTKFGDTSSKSTSTTVSDGRRGRSFSRSAGQRNQFTGSRKEYGRSLSRVDTGRRHQSVSRAHYGTSESEVENDYNSAVNLRNKNIGNTSSDRLNNATQLLERPRSLQTWSSRHPLSEPPDSSISCVQDLNSEDAHSTSSYSEAEVKTVRAVFEQIKSFQSDHPAGDAAAGGIYETVRSEVRRAVSEIRNDLENAIRRKNPAIITTANIVDIPPELVNPDAIELVSDIRREYATKLEQSLERARKLRADLAVEEQRGQELARILKEILPDPKTPETQQSRPRRKTSIERRKISKRLTEEAMNYFDECVSISTFDGSDFSAPEDPQLDSVIATSIGGSRLSPYESSSASINCFSDGHLNHNKESNCQVPCSIKHENSNPTASSTSKDTDLFYGNLNQESISGSITGHGENHHSLFADKLSAADGFQDIRNYIERFGKESQKDSHEIVRSSYNAEDYDTSVLAESLLFDKVILKNRIEYGSMLLCHVSIS